MPLKEKLIKFFTDKVIICFIVFFILGVVFLILIAFGSLFLTVSMACFSVAGLLLCVKTYKRYQINREEKPDENIFDATKIDFDEDVYQMTDVKRNYWKDRKRSRLDLLSPFLLCLILTLGVMAYFVISLFS